VPFLLTTSRKFLRNIGKQSSLGEPLKHIRLPKTCNKKHVFTMLKLHCSVCIVMNVREFSRRFIDGTGYIAWSNVTCQITALFT